MTIIVAVKDKDGILLGSDSIGSDGWNKQYRKDKKIFTSHGIGYGYTTSYRMGQILRYHTYEILNNLRKKDLFGYVVTCLVPMYRTILENHGYTKIASNVESGGEFIIVIDNEIFCIQSDFQVSQTADKFYAIGCGSAYAKGSLFNSNLLSTDDRVKYAINAACYFSNGCGGEHVYNYYRSND